MEFLDLYPENVVLGATIETNRDYPVSKAPPMFERYESMKKLPFENKIVSIEPIMNFDLEPFVEWIRDIGPVMVHVGYDNYHNNLTEPSLTKVRELIQQLSAFTNVKLLTLRESNQ